MITDLVHIAIERNRENRKNYTFEELPPITYFEEIGSVHLSLGRQLGHTSAIRALAKPWDLIISPTVNLLMVGEFPRNIEQYSAQQLMHNTRGKYIRCRTIWIDLPAHCAQMLRITEKEFAYMVYKLFGVDEEQTFVFLG